MSGTEQLRAQFCSVTAYETPSRSVAAAPGACQPSVTDDPASAPTAMTAGGSEHTAPLAMYASGVAPALEPSNTLQKSTLASSEYET